MRSIERQIAEEWLVAFFANEVDRVPCKIVDDKTIASHPNVPGFWNRTHAYNLVGFDTYLSKNDFDLSDSVDNLLLDHSYYDAFYTLDDNQVKKTRNNSLL